MVTIAIRVTTIEPVSIAAVAIGICGLERLFWLRLLQQLRVSRRTNHQCNYRHRYGEEKAL
jgi:hypothetical protein